MLRLWHVAGWSIPTFRRRGADVGRRDEGYIDYPALVGVEEAEAE